MASAVRKEIAALDSGVPTYQVAPIDQLLSASVANERFNLFLLVLFAALALGLAAVGIYGVLAFGVSRRSREIGIRLALGARRRDVLRPVVRQGMQLVIAGVLLGIAGAGSDAADGELALQRESDRSRDVCGCVSRANDGGLDRLLFSRAPHHARRPHGWPPR